MEHDPVRIYQRVVDSLFSDGIINMGRVLVLFAFTKQLCRQCPEETPFIWSIYHRALKDTPYAGVRCPVEQRVD